MSFISPDQKQKLSARLKQVLDPIDGGKSADAFSEAICDWMEEDVIPQLLVLPGIAGFGGGIPGPTVTISPGLVK